MVNTLNVVQTVLLILAISDLCWTRYFLLNEDKEVIQPQMEESVNSPLQTRLSPTKQYLLLMRILKGKNSVDQEHHLQTPEKRQRRCYWSPVACYG
ncbi:uncharacterized protein LOC134229197 isoform X2 [Saccostrea cucullata]|uniref:uncharacterized protein LOC134229197 isoform X2 n=1 Tax=Saccostrea cuccullata TaxID=36930 RepID=UPI002ED099ED